MSKYHQNPLFYTLAADHKHNYSIDEITKNIKKAQQLGARFLTIKNLDQWLLPHLKKIIEYCISLGFQKIVININGWEFCDKNYSKSIIEGHQDIIRINTFLQGPNKIIHDRQTQNMGDFDKMIKSINNIIDLNCELIINLTLSSLNYLHLKQYIDLLKKLKIKNTLIWFINSPNLSSSNVQLPPKIERLIPHIKDSIDYANSKNIHIGLIFFPFCLLGDYYLDNAVEFHMPVNIRSSEELYIEGYKSDLCQKCLYNFQCPGIWKKYYLQRGFRFKPIIR